MISDLLVGVAAIDRTERGDIDTDAAIDAVSESSNRYVPDEDREELREVLEDGWLDE